jgi:hypothetical protein
MYEALVITAINRALEDHFFSHRGKCECGEFVSKDPTMIRRHLVDKIALEVLSLDPPLNNKHQVEVLSGEVKWFTKALENAHNPELGFNHHPEYLLGVKSSLSWLERHLKMAKDNNLRR